MLYWLDAAVVSSMPAHCFSEAMHNCSVNSHQSCKGDCRSVRLVSLAVALTLMLGKNRTKLDLKSLIEAFQMLLQ